MADDYYQTLGVSKSATSEEIQKAYRKLARKYHPDLYTDAEEKERKKAKQNFQKVQQAYDVLSDENKRQMYDQYGPQFEQMAGAGGPFGGGGNPFGGGGGAGGMGGFEELLRSMGGGNRGRASGGGGGRGGMGGFEDILRQMGGGMGGGGFTGAGGPQEGTRTQAPPRGSDVEQEITVPFSTSVLGGKHQINFTRPDGKVESIEVKIPAGIESKKKIRLRGQGQPSPAGGPPGDLKVTVKVAPHPHYTRNGLNLMVTVPISIVEAAEGAKIDLPTPHGTVSLSVPPGSSSGKSLRMRGMGIKTTERSGDLIATLQVHIPPDISDDDIASLKQLGPAWNETERNKLSW